MKPMKVAGLWILAGLLMVAGCSHEHDPTPTGSVKPLILPAGLSESHKSDYYHVPVMPKEPKAHPEALVPKRLPAKVKRPAKPA